MVEEISEVFHREFASMGSLDAHYLVHICGSARTNRSIYRLGRAPIGPRPLPQRRRSILAKCRLNRLDRSHPVLRSPGLSPSKKRGLGLGERDVAGVEVTG